VIYLFLVLFFIAVCTFFLSQDSIEFARACMRIAVVTVLMACEVFSAPMALEAAVLMLVVFQLALQAFVRWEVQVDHERN
jgi:hypothetical protein